eukprot:jgi/Chrpa1/10/Chrysochromulina_OHIO_Genome00000053-RA
MQQRCAQVEVSVRALGHRRAQLLEQRVPDVALGEQKVAIHRAQQVKEASFDGEMAPERGGRDPVEAREECLERGELHEAVARGQPSQRMRGRLELPTHQGGRARARRQTVGAAQHGATEAPRPPVDVGRLLHQLLRLFDAALQRRTLSLIHGAARMPATTPSRERPEGGETLRLGMYLSDRRLLLPQLGRLKRRLSRREHGARTRHAAHARRRRRLGLKRRASWARHRRQLLRRRAQRESRWRRCAEPCREKRGGRERRCELVCLRSGEPLRVARHERQPRRVRLLLLGRTQHANRFSDEEDALHHAHRERSRLARHVHFEGAPTDRAVIIRGRVRCARCSSAGARRGAAGIRTFEAVRSCSSSSARLACGSSSSRVGVSGGWLGTLDEEVAVAGQQLAVQQPRSQLRAQHALRMPHEHAQRVT